ncbi:hypothetical protein DI487_00210 [Flavobacterium sediminis]|uniref:Right handed beta helix domain-containing protein n=1 Tax=Flavobacterium sediminis TaxID=2201181 RepID=A0A2U8QQW2_9FLAO|nr:hypothetical protein [Flavobacterium sediminis]AWM12453.1 hypothetical protein DI487_00210 [Flavobacterium sediminis]
MRHYIYILAITLTALVSCRNDFDFEPSTGNLSFSRDTVYLDTVFTNIGSSTYTLKVYNRSDKNIAIPKIELGKGESSNYRLMVDGIPGKTFQNVELLAKDSMFVFIEVTSDISEANPTDFLYTDQILFGDSGNFQKVELVTLIQDAYFLYPQRFGNGTTETLPIGEDEIYGFFLDETDPVNGNELHWNNSKPYVIYGYAAVPSTKTLIVDAGARVHFHAESGLIVANNASLQINGTYSNTEELENEVIFEGDRLEPGFADVPGQWGTIWFSQGSTNNTISNLTVKNATVGLFVTGNDGTATPTIDIQNTQIYNCSNVGILARTGNMTGRNVVINNCGETALSCSFGGSYDFTHCTFANYWATPSQYCIMIDDYDGSPEYALTQANFKNCIVYGSTNQSLYFSRYGTNDANYNFLFDSCLIKFIDSSNQFGNIAEYQFVGSHYSNCIIAEIYNSNLPDFKDPDNNEMIIGDNSAAKGAANTTYSTFNDILNNPRISPTDIGAYNFIIFE